MIAPNRSERSVGLACASVVAAILILAAASGGVGAQTAMPREAGSDETIRRLIDLGLRNIQRARCENGRFCAPTTDAELSNPPISVAEARVVIQRGASSASAQLCGLDWQARNFGPMMAYWRSQKKSERQMALIALLHGIMQGLGGGELAGRTCTEAIRRNLEASVDFRP